MSLPSDVERMWMMPVQDAFEPRLVGALMGSHEKLLPTYRGWPSCRLGRSVAAMLDAVLRAEDANEMLRAEIRLVGIALWEREQDRIAETIGITATGW
jgi:hypothetical protein